MSSKRTAEPEEKQTEFAKIQNLVGTIQQLQLEIDNLKREMTKARRIPSSKISILFLVPGIMSLIFSILNNSPVLAFIGLGLVLWGTLFFFITPTRYVNSSLLDSAATSSYATIDRIIEDLKYTGKGYYIPPYPEEVYLPEHLKGLKEMIVFISADSSSEMPSIQELAESRFLLKNPKGICITPPGLGLLTQLEHELRTDLTKLELTELCETLPPLILTNFPLAKEIIMKPEEKQVYVRILGSIYKNLYSKAKKTESIHYLGSPLGSAIACAIAKTTGKIVTIQKDRVSPDGQTIEIWYAS